VLPLQAEVDRHQSATAALEAQLASARAALLRLDGER